MQAAVKKNSFKEWMRKNGTGYAFLLPFLILFAVFVIVPVAVAMYYSLTNYNMIQPARFVGLSNYSQLILDDDVFLISLKNTMVFAVITGPIGYFASFLMAWLITLVKRGRGFFSLMFYAPSCRIRYFSSAFVVSGATASRFPMMGWLFRSSTRTRLSSSCIRKGVVT